MMAMLRSLLLLFMMFSVGNAQAEAGGWTNFEGRWFKYFPQKVNWITAERNCQKFGANLASVHGKPENDFLLSLLPASSNNGWIGAHDGEQEGQWLWSDGSVFDQTSWCYGEPDNKGTENCGVINYTSKNCWNDMSCSLELGYICATRK